jgi:3-dehydroquinate dehydratase/shikimate dehydrogenase
MERAVVCSVLERDAGDASSRVSSAPSGCALVELRADRLRAGEVEGLVRRACRPVVVTVRATRDGGWFDGSEEERRRILTAALAAGAAFVDVEWSGPLADLASGPDARRVILSHHGAPCEGRRLLKIFEAMAATPAARLKLVPRASAPADAGAIREVLDVARRAGRSLASFAMGPAGVPTRILAISWGSWATYGSAAPGRETAEGQIPAEDLLELYRALDIGPATRLAALAGATALSSPSPAMHIEGYREAGLDRLYLPLPAGSFAEASAVLGAASPIGLEALAVTIPLKEEAAQDTEPADACAAAARSVNTVVAGATGLAGFNTDGPAALACVRRHLDPRGMRAAVAGAGGTARAVGWVLARAGAKVTYFNRDRARAERAATELKGAAGSWSDLARADWDILVQATPLGCRGEEVMPAARLRGQLVVDAAYAAGTTPLVDAARGRGLAVVDGFELLVEQGLLQFRLMTGRTASRVAFESALAARGRHRA